VVQIGHYLPQFIAKTECYFNVQLDIDGVQDFLAILYTTVVIPKFLISLWNLPSDWYQ
jgi:hypothetical protein